MDKDDVLDFLRFSLFAIVVVVLMYSPILGIAWVTTKVGCNRYADMNPSYQFEYDFIAGGCFVKVGDIYVLTTNIQFINGSIDIKE